MIRAWIALQRGRLQSGPALFARVIYLRQYMYQKATYTSMIVVDNKTFASI
jgi:hypothetical protein